MITDDALHDRSEAHADGVLTAALNQLRGMDPQEAVVHRETFLFSLFHLCTDALMDEGWRPSELAEEIDEHDMEGW